MSRKGRHLFTSESVTEGHPDKIADQISDSILDAILTQDPVSRVACETLVTTDSRRGRRDHDQRLCRLQKSSARPSTIGYNRGKFGFDGRPAPCSPSTASRRISRWASTPARRRLGHDVRFACTETDELMPMPIMLAHKLVKGLSTLRRDGTLDYLRPDGKSQVTIDMTATPRCVDAVSSSSQHSPPSPTTPCARTSPRRSSTR